MKRAIIVVIDSMGVGAMPDCKDYNDVPECNTLKNVVQACGGLNVPNMKKMGLGNIEVCAGISKEQSPTSQYGTMAEKSKGKDTTTGHWEIAGLVLDEPFATFPNGFDNEIIHEFIENKLWKNFRKLSGFRYQNNRRFKRKTSGNKIPDCLYKRRQRFSNSC